MVAKLKLPHDEGDLFDDPIQYRRLIGILFYPTINRLDLCYFVNKLNQHMDKPRIPHWQAAFHILQYIKGTVGQGPSLHSTSSVELKAFSDANLAFCPDTRRLVNCYYVFTENALVSWNYKKQNTIVLLLY